MKRRLSSPLAGIAVAALFCVLTPRVSASYEYDWEGGLPGFTGALVLDKSSSNNGTFADIVSLTVTSPGGTYSFNPALPDQININQTGGYNQLEAPFTWTPTAITEMNILFDYEYIVGFGAWSYADVAENAPVYGVPPSFIDTLAGAINYHSDFAGTGNWVAKNPPRPAPDRNSSLVLLGLGLAALTVAALRKQKLCPD